MTKATAEPMQTEPTETTAIATKVKPNRRWRNRLRHGLRSRRLPFKGGKSIQTYRDEYRKAIENELRNQGREIGVTEATIVAAAVVAYEHTLKAGFWLANNHDALDYDQRLAFSREEMRGLAEAAKLLKQLGIDRNPASADYWSSLPVVNGNGHTRDADDTGVQVAKDSPNAPQAKPEAHNG